jgi:hypothetical protein
MGRAKTLSRPGFSRLRLFRRASVSTELVEQTYAERTGNKKEIVMARNICPF